MLCLSAPIIDKYIRMLTHSKMSFNKASWKLINELFYLINKIQPCGENNTHELWLTAQKGEITDYGNYEDFFENEIVSTRKEFEEMWNNEYPTEIYWYKLNTISYSKGNEFKAIFINDKIIVQSPLNENNNMEIDISDLINFLIQAVKNCIDKIKNNQYHNFLIKNLPYEKRYGTILRKKYWKIFKENKENYLKNISTEEIQTFQKLVNIQEEIQNSESNKYKISKAIGRLEKMTSNMFYYYCYLGYEANNYNGCNILSPKELYYKYADGRDENLKNIDGNSSCEFDAWYNNKNKFIGHPWEVCSGGNSTHISLFVHNDNGYYLSLSGKSFGRSIETIKFYLALKKENVPVYLNDGKELLNRILGVDKIGIVPDFTMPFYCENLFPNERILDFMHLTLDDSKEILKYINWVDIPRYKLK